MGEILITVGGWVLKLFFTSVVYPLALDIAKRREIDPEYKAQSDKIHADLQAATTTVDRKAAAKALHDLQKNDPPSA